MVTSDIKSLMGSSNKELRLFFQTKVCHKIHVEFVYGEWTFLPIVLLSVRKIKTFENDINLLFHILLYGSLSIDS